MRELGLQDLYFPSVTALLFRGFQSIMYGRSNPNSSTDMVEDSSGKGKAMVYEPVLPQGRVTQKKTINALIFLIEC